MAAAQPYNHTLNLLMSGQSPVTNTFKIALLNASASFNAAHTTLAQVTSSGANEVTGTGWSAGGIALTGVGTEIYMVNGTRWFCNEQSFTAQSGGLSNIRSAVIYDDSLTDDPPLWMVTLPATMPLLPEGIPIVLPDLETGAVFVATWNTP